MAAGTEPLHPPELAILPRVAVDPPGDAIVGWKSSSGNGDTAVRVSWRPAGTGAWQPSRVLFSEPWDIDEDVWDVDVAAGSSDRALAVWSRQDGSDWSVETASYSSSPNCRVPDVRRKRLAAARLALVRRHCATGAVARRYSRLVAAGRVISESPRPGTVLDTGAKVGLVVSRGKALSR